MNSNFFIHSVSLCLFIGQLRSLIVKITKKCVPLPVCLFVCFSIPPLLTVLEWSVLSCGLMDVFSFSLISKNSSKYLL